MLQMRKKEEEKKWKWCKWEKSESGGVLELLWEVGVALDNIPPIILQTVEGCRRKHYMAMLFVIMITMIMLMIILQTVEGCRRGHYMPMLFVIMITMMMMMMMIILQTVEGCRRKHYMLMLTFSSGKRITQTNKQWKQTKTIKQWKGWRWQESPSSTWSSAGSGHTDKCCN